MTAKEEAIRLFDRYFYSLPLFEGDGEFEHKMSKQCALLCIDEIIKDRQKDCGEDEYFEVKDNSEMFIMYWEQVKKEIELL